MLRLHGAQLREWNTIMKHRWDNADKGTTEVLGEECTSATCPTINPTCTGLGSNPSIFVWQACD